MEIFLGLVSDCANHLLTLQPTEVKEDVKNCNSMKVHWLRQEQFNKNLKKSMNKTSNAQCNCSPTADWCTISPWAAGAPLVNSLQFSKNIFSWFCTTWNTPLASVGQLSCFSPIPTPCAPCSPSPLAGRIVQEATNF